MLNEYGLYIVIGVLALVIIALLIHARMQARKYVKRTLQYPPPKIEPQLEADIDTMRSEEKKEQLNMIDELLLITSSDLSDDKRLEMVHGRLKFFRRKVTFFFDS